MKKNQKKQLKTKNKSKTQSNQEEKLLIDFSKSLYNLKAIKSAIKEYQDLADFSLKQKKGYIQVELNNIDKSVIKIIKDEFCNYVFFLMKS